MADVEGRTVVLRIRTFTGGPLATHAFLVSDEDGRSIVVDVPPGTAEEIVSALRMYGLALERIVITHPHWDHFADAGALREQTDVTIAAHPDAAPRLQNARTSLFPVEGVDFAPASLVPDRSIDEGDQIEVGQTRFRVLFTPGHEPSHIALYQPEERILISGDVIFPGGHGTLDVPGADAAAMERSLRMLAALPDDVTVYNGHGEPTSLGAERGWLSAV